MKYFIVFVAACVVAVNAAFDEEFKAKVIKKVEEVGTACAAQENANGDDIAELMAKKAPTRKEGKCLVACFHEKFGVQDKDGKLSLDGAIASIEPFKAANEEIYGKMKQVIEKCIAEVGDAGDRCETAIKFAGCGKREGEALGLNESLIM
ncbi:PREDICTED: uncharacterized protein LOC108567345 [Nicrophorus vespilloides]|uniref:Uncharacterized protein LOC108567345 n=1 Tax=Nicrophorus vespilloides TaxID=110193 RepID=A0ABM1N8U6_NICVS|nr:PREDICTED: uncharacterized protein LOC108567345 [Nicrophorus vespilloides]